MSPAEKTELQRWALEAATRVARKTFEAAGARGTKIEIDQDTLAGWLAASFEAGYSHARRGGK